MGGGGVYLGEQVSIAKYLQAFNLTVYNSEPFVKNKKKYVAVSTCRLFLHFF
jgi:hypothetical protein